MDPVVDEPEPDVEYSENLSSGYRDQGKKRSKKEPINTWWLPTTLRFIAALLEHYEDEEQE